MCGYILTFVDTCWCALNVVSSTVISGFMSFQFVEERSHTLEFAKAVEDVCTCTKNFEVRQRTVNMQRVRLNGLYVGRTLRARY